MNFEKNDSAYMKLYYCNADLNILNNAEIYHTYWFRFNFWFYVKTLITCFFNEGLLIFIFGLKIKFQSPSAL